MNSKKSLAKLPCENCLMFPICRILESKRKEVQIIDLAEKCEKLNNFIVVKTKITAIKSYDFTVQAINFEQISKVIKYFEFPNTM